MSHIVIGEQIDSVLRQTALRLDQNVELDHRILDRIRSRNRIKVAEQK